MSGIVGLWNLDGRPAEPRLLAAMSAALAHRGPDGEGRWARGPVAMACQLLKVTPEAMAETQPLVHAGLAVVVDGRLDDREELLRALEPGTASPDTPDPVLVLEAYRQVGDRFAERLHGDFALGLFDAARSRLVLARDTIGIRPLYHCRIGQTFLFASEIKALLAHPGVPRCPNDDFLADFLIGRVQESRGATFFRGVSSVPPAHTAVVTPDGFVSRRYWDFDPGRGARYASFPECAEAFQEQFERAVRRRLRSAHPVAVSVSGGLDSSSIFCLAETLRRRAPGTRPPIRGLSYTAPAGSPSDEAAFLLEIERRYAVAIERLPMPRPGLLDGAREAVWHAEAPLLDEQWSTTTALLGTARRAGARVLLTGHWGDQVLFDQAYLVDLVHRLRLRKVRAHLGEFGRWLTDVDPGQFRRRFLLDLVKHSVPAPLLPLLRRLRREPAPPWYAAAFRRRVRWPGVGREPDARFVTAHARSLYEQARSGHHVLCLEWNNKVAAMHGLDVAFPFLDRDVLSFLMAIPGEMQTWNGVPKALLRSAMHAVLPEAIVQRTWKADFTDLVNEGMRRELPGVTRYLDADGMAARLGYVESGALREALARLDHRMDGRMEGRSAASAWAVSDLLGLELWLRAFFERGAGRHAPRESGRTAAMLAAGGGA